MIQDKLFYMIPEKWDKVCLYASVLEQIEDILSGEMYFYYFPKGILKMRPVNVYEIPTKYNIVEETYTKHLEELYQYIKDLWNEFIKNGYKKWYCITINIENFRFKIEYNYIDMRLQPYSSEQNHIIWKHKNLKKDLEAYNKKERKVIENYLGSQLEEDIEIHEEVIYRNPVRNVIEYAKEESFIKEEPVVINNEILLKKGIH